MRLRTNIERAEMAGSTLIVFALILSMQLRRVTGDESDEAPTHTCSSSTDSSVYNSFEGEIRSPGYGPGQTYPPNQNCHWFIGNATKVPWKGLRFWFTDYDLADCVGDSVKIIDGIGTLNGLNNPKCEEIEQYNSTESSVRVEFISDGEGSGRGFILKYRGHCQYNPEPTYTGRNASISQQDSCVWEVDPAGEFQGLFIDVLPHDDKPSSWVIRDQQDQTDSALTGHSHWITVIVIDAHGVKLSFRPNSNDFNTDTRLTVASFDTTHPCFGNNNCGSNNCLPGSELPDSYRCDPDVCQNYPCNHGGSCYVNDAGEAACHCADGYIDNHCLTFADPCANNGCINGSCVANNSKPTCKCEGGYKGEYCNETDSCYSNPCYNGGTCAEDLDNVMLFICICADGYTGDAYDCSIQDFCFTDPCLHGNCTNLPNGPNCTCTAGYLGDTCSDVDYCAENPCQNNGQCANEDTYYTCTCPSEFRGQNCSEPNDSRHCWSGVDPYHGSRIDWSSTAMGARDTQPCPGAFGNATRPCLENDSVNPPFAYWGQPDLSGCVSERMMNIYNAVQALSEAAVVDSEEIINITASLAAAVTVDSGDGDTRLYAGDLGMATSTVGKVADLVKKTQATEHDLGDIGQSYGDAVANIVDPSTGAVWRYTQSGYLETRMASLLHSMEQLSTHLADKKSALLVRRKRKRRSIDHDTIIVTTANLDFQVRVMGRGFSVSELNYNGKTGTSSLSLPGEVYQKAVISTSDPYIHLYQARFTSFSELLAETNGPINKHSGATSSSMLNSDILATKVLNVPEKTFQSLTNAVKLEFYLQNSSLSWQLQQQCTFLNMTATSAEHRWLQQGCARSVAESNASYTVCYCTHLTNFAVLMDVYSVDDDIDDVNSKILTYLSYGGGALSILGCVISIVIFQFFRLSSERIRIHEHLALSIMLVQIFFLVGIDRTENRAVCKAMAICLHYSLVAMFCWMLVEGAHLYLVLVKVFKSRSHLKKYIAIGWGIPLVVVGISAGIFHDDYGTGSICWLTQKVLLVAFVPAVGLVVVINTVVLLVVMKTMLNSMSKGSKIAVDDRSSVRVGLKAAAVLLPLLGLTWTFGFLSINSKGTLIFTYLFTLFNSLQGVFFFVFHCLCSVDVQKAYDRRIKRKSQLRLTESSFSVRERKRSDSSMYSSSYGKQSIRTVLTDTAPATLERQRSTSSGHYYNDIVRPQSVTFDDDVFLPNNPPQRHSLHSRSSGGSFHNVVNPMPDVTDGRGIFTNGGTVFSDIRRRSASETNGYLFYYGKGNKQSNSAGSVTGIDKNALYANVNK